MRPLTPTLLSFLHTPEALGVLADLSSQPLSERQALPRLTELRRTFSADEAGALLDQAMLRQRARAKFPQADQMFFHEEALQQASGHAIASERAARYAPFGTVADLGCGIGGDTLALAAAGCQVEAYELDPIRLALAEMNAAALGLADRIRFHLADWTTVPIQAEAAFVDPARRVGGQRVFRLADMQPPLTAIHALRQTVAAVGVKVAPGVGDDELPADADVEFISEGGVCKEAVLWFGALRPKVPVPEGTRVRVATLLPGAYTFNNGAPADHLGAGPPRAFLYEPDAAIIRATLVAHLGTLLRASQLDPQIAYLTADHAIATPFARVWRVLEHAPFNLKHLNQRLRALGAGLVIVKKRGAPIDPDEFIKRLKTTPGGPTVTIFITRMLDAPWMVLAKEVMADER